MPLPLKYLLYTSYKPIAQKTNVKNNNNITGIIENHKNKDKTETINTEYY